jgi:hypothetical protein
MLRMYLVGGLLPGLLTAALLAIPAGAAEPAKTSSWASERMRLTPPPRPKVPGYADELSGTCAGLTVMIKTRIEWIKDLEAKAVPQQWPPPSPLALWARRPVGGDIARHRGHIARLNAALGAKGCQTVDVQAELQHAPAVGERTKRK